MFLYSLIHVWVTSEMFEMQEYYYISIEIPQNDTRIAEKFNFDVLSFIYFIYLFI